MTADECRWLGVHLDDVANIAHGPLVSTLSSPVDVCVIPTDEETVIARATRALFHDDERRSKGMLDADQPGGAQMRDLATYLGFRREVDPTDPTQVIHQLTLQPERS